jgi:hypothetical protein
MESDALKLARARYEAAYKAYLQRADHVGRKLQDKIMPSAEEIEAERQAREFLAIARRGLIDAINTSFHK